MPKLLKMLVAIVFSFGLFNTSAEAELINFSFGGTADFSIDGTANPAVDFLLLADADTDNVSTDVFDQNLLFLNHDSATIDLGDLGLFTLTGTSSFTNQSTGVYGLGETNVGFVEFDVNDSFFESYDLSTSFGPLSLDVVNNSASFVASSNGSTSTISITDFVGPISVSALVGTTTIPEPSSSSLLALALTGVAMVRRRSA